MSHPDTAFFHRAERRRSIPFGVLFGSPETILDFEEHELPTPTPLPDVPSARGMRHLLSVPQDNGNHRVLVRTGLSGEPGAWLAQTLCYARKGMVPELHGSVALDDGSRALSRKLEGELPITVDVFARRRLLRWVQRPKTESRLIPACHTAQWELTPGSAGILVRDMFPDQDSRLVRFELRDGMVQAAALPPHADELFDQLMKECT